MINEVLNKIAAIAYSTKETLYSTYSLSKEAIDKNIHGDFVECGVGAGSQISAMALAIKETSDKRKIYAFDSYEGIPLAGKFDDSQPGIGEIKHDVNKPIEERLTSSGITVHSLGNVKSNILSYKLPIDNIEFVKGWFQDTMPIMVNEIESISILRLDGDLYESTMVCLDYLYPKVSIGGFVIIDDYGLPGCRKAVFDYFKEDIPDIKIIDGSGSVGYFIKQKQ